MAEIVCPSLGDMSHNRTNKIDGPFTSGRAQNLTPIAGGRKGGGKGGGFWDVLGKPA
jgi:hypothetical protein